MLTLMNETFPNLHKYLELIPVAFMALTTGAVSYFNSDEKSGIKQALKSITYCAIIAILTYSMLSATDLPYLAKVGVSCALGFFGGDKALDIIGRVIELKGQRTTDQVDKPTKKDTPDEPK